MERRKFLKALGFGSVTFTPYGMQKLLAEPKDEDFRILVEEEVVKVEDVYPAISQLRTDLNKGEVLVQIHRSGRLLGQLFTRDALLEQHQPMPTLERGELTTYLEQPITFGLTVKPEWIDGDFIESIYRHEEPFDIFIKSHEGTVLIEDIQYDSLTWGDEISITGLTPKQPKTTYYGSDKDTS